MNIIKKRLIRIASEKEQTAKADTLFETLDKIKPAVEENYGKFRDELIKTIMTANADKGWNMFFNNVAYDEEKVDKTVLDCLNKMFDISNAKEYADEDFLIDCASYTNAKVREKFVNDLKEIENKIFSANEGGTINICGVTINLGTEQEDDIIESLDDAIEWMCDTEEELRGNINNTVNEIAEEVHHAETINKTFTEGIEIAHNVIKEMESVATKEYEDVMKEFVKSAVMIDYDEAMWELDETREYVYSAIGKKVAESLEDKLGLDASKLVKQIDFMTSCAELASVAGLRHLSNELHKTYSDIKEAMEKDPNGTVKFKGIEAGLKKESVKKFINDMDKKKYDKMLSVDTEYFEKEMKEYFKDFVEDNV